MRLHHIDSLDQLEPTSEGQRVFLYSIGLKTDPTYERKLPQYIDDAVVRLKGTATAVETFQQKLKSVGYDDRYRDLYRSSPGIMPNPELAPKLFRTEDLKLLRRSSSFQDGHPSPLVVGVSYDIQLPDAGELSLSETEKVLGDLLNSDVVGAT